MTADGDEPKNEFANFLDDISEEISQRVESLTPPKSPAPGDQPAFSEERHVLDWPNVADRMIDEMR
jgi:hypothetical protein